MKFLVAMREDLGAAVAALIADIKAAQTAMKEEAEKRNAELAVHAKNAEDITSALVGLEGASNLVKASKTPSLVLFKEVATTVRTALLLADAFGLVGNAVKNTVTMFLQEDPTPDNDDPMEDYKLHPDGIIATLEKLLADSCSSRDSISVLETLQGSQT